RTTTQLVFSACFPTSDAVVRLWDGMVCIARMKSGQAGKFVGSAFQAISLHTQGGCDGQILHCLVAGRTAVRTGADLPDFLMPVLFVAAGTISFQQYLICGVGGASVPWLFACRQDDSPPHFSRTMSLPRMQ